MDLDFSTTMSAFAKENLPSDVLSAPPLHYQRKLSCFLWEGKVWNGKVKPQMQGSRLSKAKI
jgi:hypothetical protein